MIESDELNFNGVSHGFFTRGGGHSTGIFASLNCGLGSGDDPELVAKNRDVVARQLGVASANLTSVYQVHGNEVLHVTAPLASADRPKADGLVCNTPGIAIGVLTADCAPLLFADPRARVIGAAHAGWKGALAGIGEAVVAAMEDLGAVRGNITAVIGPTISQANYEVGPEFPARFIAADWETTLFFKPSSKEGHHLFDLPGYLLRRLKAAGVGRAIDIQQCTYADEAKFFSYRRATHRGEQDYGRLMSAIALG
jgi:polyphenol oxidase